jgi:uncharacterized protein (UPF0335 family)
MSETAEIGHNSEPVAKFAADQLKSIIERIENVETAIKEGQSDRADIYKEAGSNGFDVPALKAIVRARRETAEQRSKREEREEYEEVYRGSLGMMG